MSCCLAGVMSSLGSRFDNAIWLQTTKNFGPRQIVGAIGASRIQLWLLSE